MVLPFCSHCGGVPCDFHRDVARLCPKADVREPLSVVDDGGDDLMSMLREWLIRTGIADDPTVCAD